MTAGPGHFVEPGTYPEPGPYAGPGQFAEPGPYATHGSHATHGSRTGPGAFAGGVHAATPMPVQTLPAQSAHGMTYPRLLLMWWHVRARLAAREGARQIRLGNTEDERRLAVFIASAVVAVILLVLATIVGTSAATGVCVVAIGFFSALLIGLNLVFGPSDEQCEVDQAGLAAVLPDAKRVWDIERARSKAERAANRQVRQAQRAAYKAEAAANAGLINLVPVGGTTAAPPAAAWLKGDGSFPLPVIGEVHIQRILEDACDGLPGAGDHRILPAAVRLEETPQDRTAVVVLIGGRKVGHLAKADAQALRMKIADENRIGPEFRCRAAVSGVLDHGRVHYEVRLDVV